MPTTVQDYLFYNQGDTANVNPYLLNYTPDSDIYVTNEISADQKQAYNNAMNKKSTFDPEEYLLNNVYLNNLKEVMIKNPTSRTPTENEDTSVQATNEIVKADPSSKQSFTGKPSSKKDIILQMRQFYQNKGLNDNAINALIGVAMSESGLNPNIYNKEEKDAGLTGYGQGIFQWSDKRKTKMHNKYGNTPTLEQQLEYSWEEINQRPELLRLLSQAKTLDEAVDYVHRGYTNGSNSGLVTPEQMQTTYQKSWQKRYNRDYNYQESLNQRIQNAYNAAATV